VSGEVESRRLESESLERVLTCPNERLPVVVLADRQKRARSLGRGRFLGERPSPPGHVLPLVLRVADSRKVDQPFEPPAARGTARFRGLGTVVTA